MKKTKKMLALVLAMVMAFAMLAVTASAYDVEEHDHECAACCEDEGIMLLGEVVPCPKPNCNGVCDTTRYHEDTNQYIASSCDGLNQPMAHWHCLRTFYVQTVCRSCSYNNVSKSRDTNYCLTLGKEIR